MRRAGRLKISKHGTTTKYNKIVKNHSFLESTLQRTKMRALPSLRVPKLSSSPSSLSLSPSSAPHPLPIHPYNYSCVLCFWFFFAPHAVRRTPLNRSCTASVCSPSLHFPLRLSASLWRLSRWGLGALSLFLRHCFWWCCWWCCCCCCCCRPYRTYCVHPLLLLPVRWLSFSPMSVACF